MSALNIIQFIAAFNFLFIGLIIFLSRKKVTYGVLLLAVFLLAKGVTLFTNLTYFMDWSLNEKMITILSSILFLYAPFLYFYARYLVSKQQVNVKKDIIHFTPFIAYFIYNCVQVISPFESEMASYSVTVAYHLQTIGYTIFAFRLLTLKGDKSNQQQWIQYLLFSFILVWAMFLSKNISDVLGYNSVSLTFKFIGIVSLLMLANLTLVMAVYSPETFFKGLRIIKNSKSDNRIITKENYQKILAMMSNKELYTNPSLKIADLSNELGFSERNTSLLIKTYHGGNFYDFLNSFRIEEAKRLFIEKQDSLTISEVIYEVGFNSKSVFNTTFKKKEGLTPTQFKKSVVNS